MVCHPATVQGRLSALQFCTPYYQLQSLPANFAKSWVAHADLAALQSPHRPKYLF